MKKFFPLTVEDIRPETRHAVAITLRPRPQDAEKFAFRAGQYLTFRRKFGDEELRRSYSICDGEGRLRVAVKRVDDGWFSNFANAELKAGDTLEAMPPQGNFTLPPANGKARHFLFVAAGSGITPVLGLLRTLLRRDGEATATLVYANRSVNSIMFRDELEDLKDEHLARLRVIHVLKSDAQDVELFTGRLDREKLDRLFSSLIDVSKIGGAFICGPEALMLTVAATLEEKGLPRSAIRYELFNTARRAGGAPANRIAEVAAGEGCEVTATLDGLARTFRMPMDGARVVDAALAAGIDAPHSCKAGVCSTCRARLVEGEVEMDANHALEDYEIRQGYILACQSRPLTKKLALTWDA